MSASKSPETGGQGDESPAAPKTPTVYSSKDGKLELRVGDCLEKMADIPEGSIDLVVTSPPYNIGIQYRTYEDTKGYTDYLEWMRDVIAEVARVLAPEGSFFLNIGAMNTNPWLAFDVAQQGRDLMTLQNHIIWAKSISVGQDTFGHFKPITSERFLNNIYEDIFHFTKKGNVALDRRSIGVPFKYKSNIARFGHTRDARCKGNIWHVPYETVQKKSDRNDHPATYPVDLVTHCLKLTGATAETVLLDPFVGTGTSLVAAQRLGCRGIGIELDPHYAADAWVRLGSEK